MIAINADPDALASAMAVKRLLWRKVCSVAISNVNVISRPDNISMVRLLGLGLTPVNSVDPRKFSKFAIVDSQPEHHEQFAKFAFDAVIDHHPDTSCKAEFRDIRPNYGATSSMATEYLRAARIKPSVKLATGLLYGIKTDTNNFARQTIPEDLRAFQFLFRHANMHLARKIEHADLRLDYLKFFKMALDNIHLRRGRVYVHLGSVVNPDVCVLIAEFFMRVNPVKWSIVSGVFDDKLIVVLRNDGVRKDAGKIAKKAFSPTGSAGGHKSMARAEIPLENLDGLFDPDDYKEARRWIVRRIEAGPHDKNSQEQGNISDEKNS